MVKCIRLVVITVSLVYYRLFCSPSPLFCWLSLLLSRTSRRRFVRGERRRRPRERLAPKRVRLDQTIIIMLIYCLHNFIIKFFNEHLFNCKIILLLYRWTGRKRESRREARKRRRSANKKVGNRAKIRGDNPRARIGAQLADGRSNDPNRRQRLDRLRPRQEVLRERRSREGLRLWLQHLSTSLTSLQRAISRCGQRRLWRRRLLLRRTAAATESISSSS